MTFNFNTTTWLFDLSESIILRHMTKWHWKYLISLLYQSDGTQVTGDIKMRLKLPQWPQPQDEPGSECAGGGDGTTGLQGRDIPQVSEEDS